MLILIIALLAVPAVACKTGCIEYGGNCACDASAEKAPDVQAASDEKPPVDKMPSYQREGIHADEPQNLIASDAKADQEKQAADFQGKKAAGL